MKPPLVSVIVPNFNHAAFLAKRLESVINQTIKDLEVIILDDCSTDNSRQIIEQFASRDARVNTHYNIDNSGSPFLQWKKGIELARGRYIWLAESDDYTDPEFLEALLNALKKHPDAGLAYCQSNFVNKDGIIIGNHLANLSELHPGLWNNDFCVDGHELLAKYMPVINIIPNAGAAIFEKNLCNDIDWNKIKGFKLAGDRYFWSQLLLKTNACFASKPMNYFRIDGNTVRSRHSHTTGYLRELSTMTGTICKMVKVPLKTKNRAVRQWIRHAKQTVKQDKASRCKRIITTGLLFAGLLRIYLRK